MMRRTACRAVSGLLLLACGGRTEMNGALFDDDSRGSGAVREGGMPAAGSPSRGGRGSMPGTGGAGTSFAGSGNDAAEGGATANVPGAGGTAGVPTVPTAGAGGQPATQPLKTLLDIMPYFALHQACQACVKEQCPTAKSCKEGSACLEHMQCVIDHCKASPPPISGAYVSDVVNCVQGAGFCSANPGACAVDFVCAGEDDASFSLGLAALSCLQESCFYTCQE